jgi:hypothetical protein
LEALFDTRPEDGVVCFGNVIENCIACFVMFFPVPVAGGDRVNRFVDIFTREECELGLVDYVVCNEGVG